MGYVMGYKTSTISLDEWGMVINPFYPFSSGLMTQENKGVPIHRAGIGMALAPIYPI